MTGAAYIEIASGSHAGPAPGLSVERSGTKGNPSSGAKSFQENWREQLASEQLGSEQLGSEQLASLTNAAWGKGSAYATGPDERGLDEQGLGAQQVHQHEGKHQKELGPQGAQPKLAAFPAVAASSNSPVAQMADGRSSFAMADHRPVAAVSVATDRRSPRADSHHGNGPRIAVPALFSGPQSAVAPGTTDSAAGHTRQVAVPLLKKQDGTGEKKDITGAGSETPRISAAAIPHYAPLPAPPPATATATAAASTLQRHSSVSADAGTDDAESVITSGSAGHPAALAATHKELAPAAVSSPSFSGEEEDAAVIAPAATPGNLPVESVSKTGDAAFGASAERVGEHENQPVPGEPANPPASQSGDMQLAIGTSAVSAVQPVSTSPSPNEISSSMSSLMPASAAESRSASPTRGSAASDSGKRVAGAMASGGHSGIEAAGHAAGLATGAQAEPAGEMRDQVAMSGTGATTPGASGTAAPMLRETFSALDSDPGMGSPAWTHGSSRQAEAGFQDPALGWIGVRADLNGGVHVSLLPASQLAAQELGAHMDGLHQHLAELRTPVDSVVVEHSGMKAETSAQGSGTHGGNRGEQGSQHSREPNGDRPDAQQSMPVDNSSPVGAAGHEGRTMTQLDGMQGTGAVSGLFNRSGVSGTHVSLVA